MTATSIPNLKSINAKIVNRYGTFLFFISKSYIICVELILGKLSTRRTHWILELFCACKWMQSELYLFIWMFPFNWTRLNVHGEMAWRFQVDVCGGQRSCSLTQIETSCDRAQTVIAVTFIGIKCILVQYGNLKQKEINSIVGHLSSFG